MRAVNGSSPYSLSNLLRPGALARLGLIAVIVLAIATGFAGVAGWLSPGRLDQARLVNEFEAVNGLLDSLIPATLTMLASDALGVIAQDTGKVGRLLAFWNIRKARDLAWDFAGHLRGLPGFARPFALDAQDALTGALGRAILTMV